MAQWRTGLLLYVRYAIIDMKVLFNKLDHIILKMELNIKEETILHSIHIHGTTFQISCSSNPQPE